MIFSREENPARPVQKYVFEIKATEDGRFIIEFMLNDHNTQEKLKKKTHIRSAAKSIAKPSAPATDNGQEEAVPKGKFTAKEDLRRQKKAASKRPYRCL